MLDFKKHLGKGKVTMAKKLLEIAADIVQAQANVGQMSPEDIERALAKTFVTLQKMQKAEDGGVTFVPEELEQAPTEEAKQVSPKESIKEDRIVCLECGAEMRQLTSKHLAGHGLTPREYKKKFGLPLKMPLSAKSLTRARSRAAKRRGLPENLIKYQEEKKRQKSSAIPIDMASADVGFLPEAPPPEEIREIKPIEEVAPEQEAPKKKVSTRGRKKK